MHSKALSANQGMKKRPSHHKPKDAPKKAVRVYGIIRQTS